MTYRRIELTKGQSTIVSAHRYEELNQYNWYALEMKSGYYQAARFIRQNGKRICVYMHREILGLAYGDTRKGDHKNGDTLDNRDVNLRIATQAQNGMNRGVQANNKCGLKGVHWNGKRWIAQIAHAGAHKYLGSFDSAQAAHAAYTKAANNFHDQFARIK